MSFKSFLFPFIYSFLCIVSVSFVFYGGYIEKINTVAIIGWLLIIPFTVLAMIYAKKTIYENYISGREAAKEGLKFIVFSTIILVVFQAIFFELDFKEYKINFIQTYGVDLAKEQIKNGNLKIAETQIPDLIAKEIKEITLFKECTSIVFKNLFLGIITIVLTAVALKSPPRTDFSSN